MKALKNINKSVKVNVMDFLKLYKFLKRNMRWDYDYFLNYMKEVDRENNSWVPVTFRPKFLLLPNYRYSSISEELRIIAGIKKDKPYDEVIKLENLSLYNLFEVEDVKESEIKDVRLWIIIEGYGGGKEARIRDLGFVIEYTHYGYTGATIYLDYRDDDIKKLEDILKTLKWAVNRKYHRFSAWRKDGVIEKIYKIENELLALLNFFYTIYTGEYEKDKTSKILEPLTDMLGSYGNTFEEVIDMVKLAATFTF
jgi:hypothetical protein